VPLLQIVLLPPAFAVGAVVMVRIILEIAGEEQPELGFAVNVSVTLPEDLSAAVGV